MRIALLTAGAGGMYCGQCLQGNTLAAALARLGADALLVPAHTPIRTDEENVSLDRVVFGGLNVYLQEKSALFRRTPWFLDRVFDQPWLLQWLGRKSASTSPEQLGALTVSVLRGEEGRQRKELEKLIRWLGDELKPDVVHLSTVLLAGMARQIKRRLGVPVVATLAGEDLFVQQLAEPYATESRQVLRQRAADLAGLIALNRYYADFMAEYLGVPRERIEVIPPGLNLEGHAPRLPPDSPPVRFPATGRTIGYLARVCPEKGLHLLVEALEVLLEDPAMAPVEVVAAGYLAERDRSYLEGIAEWLAERGLVDRVRYLGPVDRAQKIAFLQSVDVMCLPTVYPESKGLPVLEAWANRVPVVVPAHGTFPELIGDTRGGQLFAPHDVCSLAGALRQLLANPAAAAEMGRCGQEAVHDRYHAEAMARRTLAYYRRVLGRA
jgi:glycosyltransferase involved in cell wall biosynthesis